MKGVSKHEPGAGCRQFFGDAGVGFDAGITVFVFLFRRVAERAIDRGLEAYLVLIAKQKEKTISRERRAQLLDSEHLIEAYRSMLIPPRIERKTDADVLKEIEEFEKEAPIGTRFLFKTSKHGWLFGYTQGPEEAKTEGSKTK